MKKIDTMYHMSGRKENSKPTLLWNFVQKNAWHGHNYEETLDKPKLRNSLHDNWPIISKNDSWESQGKNEELFQNNWDNQVPQLTLYCIPFMKDIIETTGQP